MQKNFSDFESLIFRAAKIPERKKKPGGARTLSMMNDFGFRLETTS